MTRGKAEPALTRLLDKTEFDTETGCWLWTASKTNGGYGCVRLPGIANVAHRALYILMVRKLDKLEHLDHLCRVRLCVNPDHLEPVTQRENNRRSAEAKTHCPQGHDRTDRNTMVRSNGRRECAECNRIRARNHYYARGRS